MAKTEPTEIVRVRAQARFVRFSARKARLVLDQVRGKSLRKAEATLMYSPKFASNEVLTLLRSAAANAREQHSIPADELVIDTCFADVSKTLFRFQPRARGRAGKIRKRSCHITLVLRHDPKAALGPKAVAAAAAASEASVRTSAAQATIETESKRPRKPAAAKKPAGTAKPAAEAKPAARTRKAAADAPAAKPKRTRATKAAEPATPAETAPEKVEEA